MLETTHELAEYAISLRYEALPAEVVAKAKGFILDLLGIALRASGDADSTPSVLATLDRVAAPGHCSVVGHDRTYAAPDAALANGTLAHSLDFDDTHREGSVHPGASVIPAVLALAERERLDGRRWIAAIVVGYDVVCRLAVALDPRSHYDRGFHPTATCGVFGATAAGANLLGLSSAELENAFGINGSQAAGSLQFFDNGAWNKRIHPGLAARNAMLALEFARSGFLGASHPIEGTYGFLHGYSDRARAEKVTSDLGRRFEIMATAIKPYPACRYAHAPLDGIIEMAVAHDLRPEEIESVRIGLCTAGTDLIGRPLDRKHEPHNVVDGQFSMPFVTAVALTRRRMTWADYDLLDDAGVRELTRKVDVVVDAEADRLFPEKWLGAVEIRARGRTFTDRRWRTRGEPEVPLTWSEIEAKFHDLASGRLAADRRNEIVAAVRDLDHLADIGTLAGLLRAEARVPVTVR